MSVHHTTVCRCGNYLSTCRCPARDKAIRVSEKICVCEEPGRHPPKSTARPEPQAHVRPVDMGPREVHRAARWCLAMLIKSATYRRQVEPTPRPQQTNSKGTDVHHVAWMLLEVMRMVDDRKDFGKACRWLGFAQCFVVVQRIATIDEVRALAGGHDFDTLTRTP